MHTWFGIGTLILGTISYFFYVKDILVGKTKPHAFSWLVWGLLGLTVWLIQVAEQSGPGAWGFAYSAIACTLVFLLALKKGERNIVFIDWIFLAGALLAYFLWLFTEQALPSIILLSLIDAIGYLPTFRKSYHKPFEETASMYWLSMIKNIFTLLALDNFTFATSLYSFTLFVMNTSFTTMLYWRRWQLQKNRTRAARQVR